MLANLKLPPGFPEVAIYFGSQTGTAEKFSNALAEEAHLIGAKERVIDMEKFSEQEFKSHKLILACVATHYEGDPTDNAK
jgi:NADPH-ferrihemoprotein reductase